MNQVISLSVVALVVLLLLTGCKRELVEAVPPPAAAAAAAPATQPADVQVVIDNFTFAPATLTIDAGKSVMWTNHDDVPHTVTSTSKPRTLDSGTMDTDQKFTYVFKTPGTYPYFCAVHPHMTGTVIVK